MKPSMRVAIPLLAAHILLAPEFQSLNRRFPKDLLALPSEIALQLAILALATLVLAGAVALLGWSLSRVPGPAGRWAWPCLGALALGCLAQALLNLAFPWAALWLGTPDLLWRAALPSILLLGTWVIGLEPAQRWVSKGVTLALFTLAGLWLPLSSAMITGSFRQAPAPRKARRSDRDPAVWVLVFDELDGRIAGEGSASPKLLQELQIWGAQSFVTHQALTPKKPSPASSWVGPFKKPRAPMEDR